MNIENILISLNLHYVHSNNYYKVSSPFREDRHPSMIVYPSGYVIDFGGTFRGNIKTLWKVLNGNEKVPDDFFIDKKNVFKKVQKKEICHDIDIIGEKKNYSESPELREYMKRRCLSKESCDHFNISYIDVGVIKTNFSTRSIRNKILIPMITGNELKNIEIRSVKDDRPKVLYVENGTTDFLYNSSNLLMDQELIITEGIIDAISVWDRAEKNVTCFFGASNVTKNKVQELLNFKHITIFPDGDAAGFGMVHKFAQMYRRDFSVCFVDDKDPNDLKSQEIREVLNGKQKYSDFLAICT